MDPHPNAPATDAALVPDHDHTRTYLRVFGALLVLTVLEYLYARLLHDAGLMVLITGLVSLAAIKAALVGMFFMHLAFEGRWKYMILVPTAFLALALVSGLFPDVALDSQLLGPPPPLEREGLSAQP